MSIRDFRRGGEDKMLDDLEKSVLKIYEECIGKNEANISTIDMLRHIELRMESLTQEQEILNPKKVLARYFVVMKPNIFMIRWKLPE